MVKAVVVVGSGLAGLRTVERLRGRGYTGQITLLGAERHLPYDRPPLSKQVLRREQDEPWLRAAGDYAGLDVDLRLEQRADGVEVDRGLVHTGGAPVPYDALVIATGARPRRVPGVHGQVLRTWDDAASLRTRLVPDARLAIIGAGLIGCEVAATARSLGVQVDLIDVQQAPMIRAVGPVVAAVLTELHDARGVRLHLGTCAERVSADRLVLDDGTGIGADLVLEAIGVVPDTDWLADSTVPIGDGVLCDAEGRTTAEGIFAVGDVARWDGVRSEHWTSAVEQADCVAAAILGQPAPSPSIPYWWSDQYDLKLQGLGAPDPDDDVELLSWGPKARTVAVYSRDGRLTGAVGFSAARAVMGLRTDIAAGTAVADVLARLAA